MLLFSITSQAQHYFGIWEGNNEPSYGWLQPKKVVLELYKENDSTIIGASHLYYKGNKYEHYSLKGKINPGDQSIQIEEVAVLSIKLGFFYQSTAGTYFLKLYCNGNSCTLKGTWKPKRNSLLAAKSINTYFRRDISDSSAFISQTNTPEPDKERSKALNRQPDIQSLIEIDSKKEDSIYIKIYDNAEIDQDSISLYLDDSAIVFKQQISTNPIILTIPTSKLKSISKLKLIAESLGSIPPCTATLIINIGRKRHEVNLSSNFEKNGIVEFFLK